VEFADYIVVVEAPLNEQRSLAVIDEVKKLIPGKPIRYVVSTHHHFDHSGGLRAYVAEGSTIVTSDINRDFYQKSLARPRTLNPDRLAQSPKKPNVETTGDKKVLTDGTRTLEIDLIKGSPHNDGILLAFLPKEKILIEADVFTPPAPVAPAPVNPSSSNLVDNVEKLRLDFETILPLHGPGAAPRADLYAAVRKPMPSITQILSAPVPDSGAGRGGGRGPAQPAPAVQGKAILEGVCTSCHTLARVEGQKLTVMEWRAMVERMIARGADLSDDDASVLVDYLAKTYPAK
jgi:glyoxylase-like metal-dependent hydrolase (beta-lactamase superfamily II)